MPQTAEPPVIDLRDEVQYLRELVEKLLADVIEARKNSEAGSHFGLMPIVLPAPPPVVIREYPRYPGWQDFGTWTTTVMNTAGETLGGTTNITWNG